VAGPPQPPPEVTAYYAAFAEEDRLASGPSQLEFERTREILTRILPPPPATIVDVGGAAGAYSLWLAARGYEVHLVDASPRLVDAARRRSAAQSRGIASLTVGDARSLPQADGLAAAVLVLGPLYHLPEAEDRLTALGEAFRIVAPGGVVAVAAISRFASTLAGIVQKLSLDPRFVEMRDRALATGLHRNDTGRIDYFTTAYFHRPEELRAELERSRFQRVQVLGIEGPAEWVADFEARWADDTLRADLLDVARRLEAEPSIIGMSAHLLGLGWK